MKHSGVAEKQRNPEATEVQLVDVKQSTLRRFELQFVNNT